MGATLVRVDRQTNVTKVIGDFRDSANARNRKKSFWVVGSQGGEYHGTGGGNGDSLHPEDSLPRRDGLFRRPAGRTSVCMLETTKVEHCCGGE